MSTSKMDDVEESEVFEITDFTTASEWERFIARLEQVIHDWKLPTYTKGPPLKKGELTSGQWEEQTEPINFANVNFIITEHRLRQDVQTETSNVEEQEEDVLPQAMDDMLSMENDFPPVAHCLSRWYGLRHFLVLTPRENSDCVLTESKVNLLLSSITIAVNNTNCAVPIFAQIQHVWRRMYTGVGEAPGVRTNFDMVHLKRIPHQFNHMEGLLNMFKSKIATPVSPFPSVNVAIRFTYILQDWTQYSWTLQPPDLDDPQGDDVGYPGFKCLPFGAVEDPINELHLRATWPSLAEETIVDNDVYSDLEPLQAPQWSVRIRVTDNPQCLLGEYLTAFVKLAHSKESTDQLLGKPAFDDLDDETSEQISHALQKLTDPGRVHLPGISSVVSRARTRMRTRKQNPVVEAPIPVHLLNEMLFYLFPDANSTEGESEDEAKQSKDAEGLKDKTTFLADTQDRYRHFKTAPEDSLTYKLAVLLCVVNHSHGGLKAVAHLWQEFVLEMRYRLENNYIIPGLGESTHPNMGCCLLHQKLQMLNCCIDRKIAREERLRQQGLSTTDSSPTDTSNPEIGSLETNSKSKNDNEDEDSEELVTPREEDTQKVTVTRISIKSESDSEDEFFECADQTPDTEQGSSISASGGRETSPEGDKTVSEDSESKDDDDDVFAGGSKKEEVKEKETDEYKPEGRLTQCGELRLLYRDDELYIPVTQDPAPMTEDMLEEHAEVLANLGTSIEGAELRAKMQSACLLSDMEAFKAANPGCVLEDFVRWYSPRDWIDEDEDEDAIQEEEAMEVDKAEEDSTPKKQIRGQLSQRMQLPGNTWLEVWGQAKPVPAHRQRRLFDDTKEAEKVLHFLSSLLPGEVVLHLMPLIIHAALRKLEQIDIEMVVSLKTHFPMVVNTASRITRSPVQDIKKYEDLVKQLGLFEIIVARHQSLQNKFLPKPDDGGATPDEKEAPLPGPDVPSPSGGTPLSPKTTEDLQKFVTSLLEEPEVDVIGASRGTAGAIIHKLFTAAQRSAHMLPDQDDDTEEAETTEHSHSKRSHSSVPDFPRPAGREFILRTSVPRPAPYSQPTPQRMYCVLVDGDFRIAGAFSQDTTFQ